jgi:hypothetical protein
MEVQENKRGFENNRTHHPLVYADFSSLLGEVINTTNTEKEVFVRKFF